MKDGDRLVEYDNQRRLTELRETELEYIHWLLALPCYMDEAFPYEDYYFPELELPEARMNWADVNPCIFGRN